jgi:hypothetical protein
MPMPSFLAMADIAFLIPLRAREASNDWSIVSRLANRTVASLLSQTNPNWRCVLSCNEPPEGLPQDARITVITHDHPIPTDFASQMWDKGMKKLRAIRWLCKHPSRYAMLVDADDLVHRDLAAFVVANDAECWLIRHGWSWHEGRWPFLVRENAFDQKCGSCYVLRLSGRHALRGEDFAGRRSGHALMQNHTHVERHAEARTVPFRAVVRCLGTGENAVGSRKRNNTASLALRSYPFTRRLRSQFGLLTE